MLCHTKLRLTRCFVLRVGSDDRVHLAGATQLADRGEARHEHYRVRERAAAQQRHHQHVRRRRR